MLNVNSETFNPFYAKKLKKQGGKFDQGCKKKQALLVFFLLLT